MEDGRIEDNQLTASSEYNDGVKPKYARLNLLPEANIHSGVWRAAVKDTNQWIQVNLTTPTIVTGVITQGRHGLYEWVTHFKLQYSDNGDHWQFVSDAQQQVAKVRIIWILFLLF